MLWSVACAKCVIFRFRGGFTGIFVALVLVFSLRSFVSSRFLLRILPPVYREMYCLSIVPSGAGRVCVFVGAVLGVRG